VTTDDLARVKPAFTQDGTVTAGDASGSTTPRRRLSGPRRVRDGHGYHPLGRLAAHSHAGAEP
jgi:acetyl-CoA C-acetyltransferase